MEITRNDVQAIIMIYVLGALGLTILFDIATIITSPILLTPGHCGAANEHITYLSKVWSICQSIPLMLVFIFLVTAHNWSPWVTSLFSPAGQEYIMAPTYNKIVKKKNIPDLRRFKLEGKQLYELDPRTPTAAPRKVFVESITRSWVGPRSTSPVVEIRTDYSAKHAFEFLTADPDDWLRDEAVVTGPEQCDGRFLLLGGPPRPVPPPRSGLPLGKAPWRDITPEYYAHARYSVTPPGSSGYWYDAKRIVEERATYLALFFTAIHVALAVWGTVLVAQHGASGEMCPGDVKMQRFLFFALAWHLWIPLSFGILFLVYHAV